MVFSGIGCSGRLSHYLNTYSLHGTHGRALPTAVGAKAARPELNTLVVGGDGDGFGIGGGHIAHASRKNADLVYLILDNQTYGLTKGQTSPTTPVGCFSKTSPFGSYEDTLEPLPVLLSYDISFVARTSSIDLKEMTTIITAAIKHPGFAVVHILTPCLTFPVLDKKTLKENFRPLSQDHDTSSKMKAIEAAYSKNPAYTGIFYRVRKPILEERLENQRERIVGKGRKEFSLSEILAEFR
jgi:2-oxoglutarate ferredoxin oxidoreductase subunit beta